MEVNEITYIVMEVHNYQNGLNQFQGHGLNMKGQGHLQNNNR